MQNNYIVRNVDESGNVVDCVMTDEEIEAWQKANQAAAQEKENFENQRLARESALAKLAALGLTEEEIAAL